MLYDNKQSTLCFEARRKCEVGFIHNQLASSYANVPQQLASSPSTVGFITRDFHALISRQHSQTNRRSLHTLFLTSKSQCMQKIRSVDALLTTQNVLSWFGRFGGGHTGWSQLQLASSVSPLWALFQIMAWHRLGDRSLSESVMVRLLTHICIMRSQWVKGLGFKFFSDFVIELY